LAISQEKEAIKMNYKEITKEVIERQLERLSVNPQEGDIFQTPEEYELDSHDGYVAEGDPDIDDEYLDRIEAQWQEAYKQLSE
jgi:hypothetical protein